MAIRGSQKKELTIEQILKEITEFDIYCYYMPNKDWVINKVTNSPFSVDKTPSFIIGNKYGNLIHTSFNDGEKKGDCFSFVKQLYNLSNLNAVLEKIDFDFGLGIKGVEKDYKKITSLYKQPIINKRNTLIQVSVKPFTKEELAYWNMFHQDISDLKANNIYSIKEVYLNRQKFPIKATDLRFGYFYDGFWKIYRPYGRKREKWVPNNVPITAMDGKENIKDCKVAFINKSKKDYMVVKKVFPCSCAVQNEGIGCFSEENVKYLKDNSEKQILGFDSDAPGVKNSQQITSIFDFDYCNVPRKYLSENIKDFADLARYHGLKTVEEVLKQKGIL